MFRFLKYCWLFEKTFHFHWVFYRFFLKVRTFFQYRADKSYEKYQATLAVMDKMDEADDAKHKKRSDAEFYARMFVNPK